MVSFVGGWLQSCLRLSNIFRLPSSPKTRIDAGVLREYWTEALAAFIRAGPLYT